MENPKSFQPKSESLKIQANSSQDKSHLGVGQKLKYQGTAGFSLCFHWPGIHRPDRASPWASLLLEAAQHKGAVRAPREVVEAPWPAFSRAFLVRFSVENRRREGAATWVFGQLGYRGTITPVTMLTMVSTYLPGYLLTMGVQQLSLRNSPLTMVNPLPSPHDRGELSFSNSPW